MEDKRRNIVVGSVIIVLFIAIIGVIIYDKYHTMNVQSSFESSYQDKTAYIEELEQIENQLKVLKEAIDQDINESIVIAYDIHNANDVDYIKKQEKIYNNQPVIVVDCNKSTEELDSIFKALSKESYTIMLTETTFKKNDIQKAIDLLKDNNLDYSSTFLTRRIDINSEETKVLQSLGFQGYTVFAYDFTAGYENKMTYFQYTYLLKTNADIDSRIQMITNMGKPMVVVISLDNRADKSLNDQTIDNLLKKIQNKVNKKELSYASIDDIHLYLSGKALSKEEKKKAYDEYYSASKERMEELKKLIKKN